MFNFKGKNQQTLVKSGNKMLSISKGFTIIELVVTMVLSTILGTLVFEGISNIVTAQSRDKVYRTAYSVYSEGMVKLQKTIFENATSLSGALNTTTSSGSILSFIKEDDFGVEKTYFVNLDDACQTTVNSIGKRIILTDGASDIIRLTGCLDTKNHTIRQRVIPLSPTIPEKVLSYEILITNTLDGTVTTLKTTMFTKN